MALGRSPQFLTGCWPEALILCHVDVGFDIRLIEYPQDIVAGFQESMEDAALSFMT